MIAFVDAMAGMMFLTTPCVRDHVTPSILNSFARADAVLYSHPMCSGSSVSSFLSRCYVSSCDSFIESHTLAFEHFRPLQDGRPLYAVFG